MRLAPYIALGVGLLAPAVTAAQTPTPTGSAACASLVQAAANGLNTRIAEDQQTITTPKSVTQLTCLNGFFSGTGLNLITNLLNPTTLLQAVEGQLCSAVTQEWQSIVGSSQCGLTLTGFNLGFGGLGGGLTCPKLSFGGGGPPIGGASTTLSSTAPISKYYNGQPTVPTGYPVVQAGGIY